MTEGRPHAPGARTRVLFIGDVVGRVGVDAVADAVPILRERHEPAFVIANAENADITAPNPVHGCGLTPESAERLLAAGVDLITGGNHSWDGPRAAETLRHPGVLRPHNYGRCAPGRGTAVLERDGVRLGVVNLVGRSALPYADTPHDALVEVLAAWEAEDAVDAVLVDMHGESVSEKQILAWAVAGRVAAVLGTHTHVATLDARILPPGTAYVSDVGMTGPGGGMQGYAPSIFVEAIRTRMPIRGQGALADGPLEWGAVLVTLEGPRAVAIERLASPDAPGGGTR